jgi:hypothetical protein
MSPHCPTATEMSPSPTTKFIHAFAKAGFSVRVTPGIINPMAFPAYLIEVTHPDGRKESRVVDAAVADTALYDWIEHELRVLCDVLGVKHP